MERSFLQKYLDSFHRIEGWFSFDAALLFIAYNQLRSRHQPAGDVLEIGVHHGLSTIAVAALRGEGKRVVAIDLFESRQDENVSRSGAGNRPVFQKNLREFHPDLPLTAITAASGEIDPSDVGRGFTFCHIDGGHSRQETCADLSLCVDVSAPGGLIAVDDYFNPMFPGVGEGVAEFMLRRPGVIKPLAAGYNKVIFQKRSAAADLNAELLAAFPGLEHKTAIMWDEPVLVLAEAFRKHIDLHASTPERLVRLGTTPVRAVLRPQIPRVRVRPGERALVPVSVQNSSQTSFPAGRGVFGLSSHLLSTSGETLIHDNDRAWIAEPLQPGAERVVELPVVAPKETGKYRVEIDLVWEGVMWFKDVANPPAMVDLIVSGEVPPAENVLRPLQRLPGTAITALCMLGVFLLNAFLCHELFHREFTERMESIESSYMSVSRWAMDHTERGWFPVWFNGMPFRNVYNPGLPSTVATVARAAGWTAQHSYHFLTALEYCLGPITLFWLCWRVTRSRGFGVTAALLYSLFSPACLFGPLIRADTAHLLTARRFLILVHYGEGPHTTAVMMVPLVILTLHYALTERKLWAIALAPLALAAVVLTNWPGSVGLCMAIAAFLASRLRSERPIHWPLLAGIAVVAYLIACPWIPPSTIALAQRNAQQSDNTVLGATQLIGWALIAVAVLVFHFVFQRVGTDRWLRFFAYFTFITGTVAIGREWFDWRLLPQPYRFQVEFELAFCALIAYGGKRLYDALPDRWRLVLVCGLTVFFAAQAVKFRRYAESQVRAIDITRTIEYRMAKWFDGHMGGARVFAPGNVSLWMNMFTDTPQVAGCCDQGVPTYEERIATYVIYTGQNAGSRDGEVSLLWLRAYGADAIGISGPKSTEYFHPYWTPGKFEGVLPVLWRDGDNAVYDVQRRSRSLAHVVTPQQLVMRPPVNGLDTADLERYVSAIEAPNAPRANFRWVNTRAGRVEADASAGRVVSVQISYDPGWQATVGGAPRRTFSDALGLLVIDPACQGRCTIDLTWTGGREAKWTKAGQAGGFIVLLGWIAVGLRRQRAATAS